MLHPTLAGVLVGNVIEPTADVEGMAAAVTVLVTVSCGCAEALTPEVLELAGVARQTMTELRKPALLLCGQAGTLAVRANRLCAAAGALERQIPPG